MGEQDILVIQEDAHEQRLGNSSHMTFEEFITKHEIDISPNVISFCQQGVERMRSSVDPAHNVGHLERMFTGLSRFVDENKDLEIDFETLLISISWHDIWRATNFQPNLVGALRSHFTEGRNAAKSTAEEMAKAGFEQNLIDRVRYCVGKHPDPQFAKRESLESQILHDLDHMDSWSEERLQEIKGYLSDSSKGKYVLPLLKRVKGTILSKANHKYYFDSSQRERDRRFPKFTEQVEKLFR